MAQALFDDHPLEQYLRDAGEMREFIPGSSAELELELDPITWEDDSEQDKEKEWRPLFLIKLVEVFLGVISALNLPSQPSPFVEHFKYDIVSSSLLSHALPSLHGRTPRSSPVIPGQLDHSRASSIEHPSHTNTPLTPSSDPSYLIPSFLITIATVFLITGHTFSAVIFIGITLYSFKAANETPKLDMSPSLESLGDLIASSNEWESVVQETLTTLEHEERSTSYGAVTSSPSSSLRIALHSSLLTTQTQCDNIRHLFSALTSPSEVSQLSEMYAPPSPTDPFHNETFSRPLSLPVRRRTLSMPNDSLNTNNKRATWNGSYTKLPHASSSTAQIFRRREKRRSDLSSLLQTSSRTSFKTASAPVTPAPASPGTTLPLVSEEQHLEEEGEFDLHQASHTTDGTSPFGKAALELRRTRISAGMDVFKMSSPNDFNPISPRSFPLQSPPFTSTLSPGSRFTPIQVARHPLSLSALNNALQGALASKRYACSHLLALRFGDEEDDGYWENVRSVMELLTSTLVDASSRLSVALEEVEQQKLRDQSPTPCLVTGFPITEDDDKSAESSTSLFPRESRRMESISFAPLPSHVSRFAIHVEAIMTALDDARENLEQCVASLRDECRPTTKPSQQRKRRSRSSMLSDDEPLALKAYERLRRELGLALRECERGKERLLDVISPPDLYDGVAEDGSDDELPGLGHDGSDDSDKLDSAFPPDDDVDHERSGGYTIVASDDVEGSLDDTTSHLLLSTSSQHLPAPGIEQVFEADSGSGTFFKREKSKLTREERIRLAKARRECGDSILGLGIDNPPASLDAAKGIGVEKWGPGTEVVQELKDVIWKVRERRLKMAGGSPLDNDIPSQ